MSRLIDDLMDFASIQAGALKLHQRRHSVDSLVSAVIDMFEGSAAERELDLEAAVASGLPPLNCDHDRTVQALANAVVPSANFSSSCATGSPFEGTEYRRIRSGGCGCLRPG